MMAILTRMCIQCSKKKKKKKKIICIINKKALKIEAMSSKL